MELVLLRAVLYAIGESQTKKCELTFFSGSTDITGLAEINYACLSGGVLNSQLKLGIGQSQVKEVLAGTNII